MTNFITKADVDAFKAKANEFKHWANEYLGVPWTDSFKIGEECEYLDYTGTWRAARVLDYLMEDRPYYVIEYVDHVGRLRDQKATASWLRRIAPPIPAEPAANPK